ncbi:hypothetical protein Vadar_004647 [Vaccinium darrowii]|uniref:Uncharacterized protein n=1 Tax=Vaccinium darrowii TaxID=229202 RepID=A0ACB7Z1M3_9ERIC|nr:hypothetical protein Vadar_004647 [Vaccinium darrowii]
MSTFQQLVHSFHLFFYAHEEDEIIPHLVSGRLQTVDPDAIQPYDKEKLPSRPVRISAWKLAKLDSNKAAKAGEKARASSSVLRLLLDITITMVTTFQVAI